MIDWVLAGRVLPSTWNSVTVYYVVAGVRSLGVLGSVYLDTDEGDQTIHSALFTGTVFSTRSFTPITPPYFLVLTTHTYITGPTLYIP
jgi:hypothetical protein